MSSFTPLEKQEAPPTRANVTPAKPADRARAPRKWSVDDSVWMRETADDTFDYKMFVNSWHYNEGRKGWDYKLRYKDGVEYEHLVKETDTKRA